MQKYRSEFHWRETNMKLISDSPVVFEFVKSAVINSRLLLEKYIIAHPEFQVALEPLEVDQTAPEFIRNMMSAALQAGVGPMASVAGGLSEVATEVMAANKCNLCLAENGGDISIKGSQPITIGVYAGKNKIAQRIGFKIKSSELPLGVCTSAGSIGHSISLGDSDAVIIFSKSAYLSDAAATAVANLVKSVEPQANIQRALEKAESIKGIKGCMIFCGDLVGTTGKLPNSVEVIDSDL